MNTETIGTWAGEVWNALNGNGELNLKQLKKLLNSKTKKSLPLSVGLLVRVK